LTVGLKPGARWLILHLEGGQPTTTFTIENQQKQSHPSHFQTQDLFALYNALDPARPKAPRAPPTVPVCWPAPVATHHPSGYYGEQTFATLWSTMVGRRSTPIGGVSGRMTLAHRRVVTQSCHRCAAVSVADPRRWVCEGLLDARRPPLPWLGMVVGPPHAPKTAQDPPSVAPRTMPRLSTCWFLGLRLGLLGGF
jgi:hypothetical protein